MRWPALLASMLVPMAGCTGDDSGTETGSTVTVASSPTTAEDTSDGGELEGSATGSATTESSGPSTITSGDTSSGSATLVPTTEGGDASSSDGGPDCTAPADCAECWSCAVAGPCMAPYQSCQSMFNCAPSLICIESTCTGDGLMQSCADTCCMSCTDLMTCPMVDAVITCVEQACAASCGAVSCP